MATSSLLPRPCSHPQCRTFAAKPKRRSNSNTGKKKPKKFKGRKSAADVPKEKKKQPKTPKPKKFKPSKEPRPSWIPPALLLPTASPFVYISRAAFGEEEENPVSIAKTIFAEIVDTNDESDPPFQGLTFDYFPPKTFEEGKAQVPQAAEGNRIIPEVAFLGRSNVGKSSLINSLMKKDLARCSKHPGRTQQPYYYGLVSRDDPTTKEKPAAFVVDLPGYGYANAPGQNVEEWQKQTQTFLKSRRGVGSFQRLFLLIDARRGLGETATSRLDLNVMRWMDEEDIPYTVVVTKLDCVGTPQMVKVANEACTRYQQQHQLEQEQMMVVEEGEEQIVEMVGSMSPFVHLTSARKGDGLRELRSAVESEFVSATLKR